MATNDDRITWPQALAALDVVDGHVHCFTQAYDGVTLYLVGAEWRIEVVEKYATERGIELAGDGALAMQHGLAIRMPDAPYFFATNETWTENMRKTP